MLRLLTVFVVLCAALNLKLAVDLDANRRTLADLEHRVEANRSTLALELESLRVRAAERLVLCRPSGLFAPLECTPLEDLPPCGRLEPPPADPRT